MRIAVPGARGMFYYRVYFYDRFSGHIDHFREFEAEDDEQALALAQGWFVGTPMELWNRHRQLKRWDPSRPET